MKIEITKDWCMRMAQLEADAEIGAGPLAIDPAFDGEASPVDPRKPALHSAVSCG